MYKKELLNKIEEKKNISRSAWKKGVCDYAYDLIEETDFNILNVCDEEILLNGAENWKSFSYGGCSLIYDNDICERLCNNTEKKLTNYGEKMPNKLENWLDVQARALYQAFEMIKNILEEEGKNNA